jgi:VWFA-related protein
VICLVVAIAVSNSATAQVEVVPSTQAVFSGSVNVELINIDVFVSDRHGNPVADLGIDDFELFEDGEAVTISHFAAVDTPARTLSDDSLTDRRVEDRSAADELQEGLLPHLVIAFDSRHLTHTAKRRMMKGMREFIRDTSIPHNRIMIMHLGHDKDQSFDVVVPFGSTLEDLEVGLDRVKDAAPGGRAVEVSYRIAMDNISEAHMEFRRRANYTPGSLEADPNSVCTLVRSQWLTEIRSFSAQTTVRVDGTVQRLVGLMQLLSGVPGHKSFLYVGSGLELVPGEDLYVYANRICQGTFSVMDAQSNNRTAVMKRLTEAANTYRISFNAFEASSFRLEMLASPEFRFAIYTPGTEVERTRTMNLQNGLVMLASETGGKAMLNSNGFFPEPEVVERALFSYYSLGYSPLDPDVGKSHEIKVTLKEDRGMQLRYRHSYGQRSERERLEDKLMSVLALGWSHNPLDISLDHGDITPVEGKKDSFLVPLSVTVPVNSLVCTSEQGRESVCRVRLQMRVCDEKDRVSPLFEKFYDIRLPENAPGEEKVTIRLTNVMRRGNQRLVVGVMDDMGLTTSYLVHPVSVGDTSPRDS